MAEDEFARQSCQDGKRRKQVGKPRKVVQIIVVPEGENYKPAILALAEDGSIWIRGAGSKEGWLQIPALPDAP